MTMVYVQILLGMWQVSVQHIKQYHNTPMEAQGGERMYSSHSFMTSALDEGEWSASRPGRALCPGKGPPYPLNRRLGGPQSRSGHRGYRKNPLPVPGPVVQSVARHYTAGISY
jgi:hypothetical protein